MELMVTLAVSAIILLAVTQFFISSNRTNTVLEKVSGTQQGIRSVMAMMTREIRMAGLDPTGNAGAGFTNAQDGTSDNSIAFSYDYYDSSGNPVSDGDCDDDREHLCFSYDPANRRIMYRQRNAAGNWQSFSLTENGIIDSMMFEYFENNDALENDAPLADPSGSLEDIRIVRITICGTITGAYEEDLDRPHCFSGVVRPRNL